MPAVTLTRASRRTFSASAALGVAFLLVPATGAAGSDSPPPSLTVEGTLVHVVVDRYDHDQVHADDGGRGHLEDDELEVESYVQVDEALHRVPEAVVLPPATTGDAVTVTLAADAGVSPQQAAEAATGERDDVAVTVVDVELTGEVGEASVGGEPLLQAATTGTRTLVVLPVYWSTRDAATRSSLQSLTQGAAAYWNEQSGGRLAIAAQARDWAQIADPGTCNAELIRQRALAAHGVTAASGQHVAVYFPYRQDCGGWAGMASIGGGIIWINGTQLPDVLAHELGHNFGLGHANTATCVSGGSRLPLVLPFDAATCPVTEYADRADVMGIGLNRASGNLNTAFADHLGYAHIHRPPAGTSTVDLAPVASTGALRAIALPVQGGTVYLEYRPATGRDVRMPAWAGVQARLVTRNASGTPRTFLLDLSPGSAAPFSAPALGVGSSWVVPGTSRMVTVHVVGATARVSVSDAAPSAVERYVSSVYGDLFGRPVDPAGLVTWTAALNGGTPRVAVANAITGSVEYRQRLVQGSYGTYLGRSADPGGLAHWVEQMGRGMTIQAMEAGFVASAEYYQNAGGTSARWITRLYQHVLGREPGASEVQHWERVLAGGAGRERVALGFLLSTEHLTAVVDGHYVHLLGRHIDPSGRSTWVSAIQGGVRVEAVIGGIVASEEYYGKA